MKLTPRIRVTPQYQDSPFVEMRFVRLGPESYTATVIFRIIEEARHPESKSKRDFLMDYHHRMEDHVRKALEVVLDPRVSDEDMLAMWNYDMFLYESLKSGFECIAKAKAENWPEFIEKLQRTFSCRFVRLGEQEVTSSAFTIHYDFSPDSVLLLYKEYTMNSFVVAPECKHIHLKFNLFEKARSLMNNKPTGRSTFTGVELVCGVGGCSQQLSGFVFDAGVSCSKEGNRTRGAEMYQVLIGAEDLDAKLEIKKNIWGDFCCYCHERKAAKICVMRGCKVCEQCAAIAYYQKRGYKCPVCGTKMVETIVKAEIEKNGAIEGVRGFDLANSYERQEKGQVIDLTQSSSLKRSQRIAQVRQQCEKCGKAFDISTFLIFMSISDGCLHCNECLAKIFNSKIQACPTCNKTISSSDRKYFETYLDKRVLDDIINIRCLLCSKEGNLRLSFSYISKTSHWWKCKVCDSCLRKGDRNLCNCCQSPYSPEDLEHLRVCWDKQEDEVEMNEERKEESPSFKRIACGLCNKLKKRSQFGKFEIDSNLVCKECYQSQQSAFLENSGQSAAVKPLSVSMERSLSDTQQTACPKCLTLKDNTHFTIVQKIAHRCIACDECLAISDFRKCSQCDCYYSDKDFDIIAKTFPSRAVRPLTDSNQISETFCICHNPIREDSVHCTNKCLCSLCLLKQFLRNKSKYCPRCNSFLLGYLPAAVQCSGCFRTLNLERRDLRNQVAGICTKNCILCVFCIKASEYDCECSVCRSSVSIDNRQEVREEQKRFKLGCYCGDNESPATQTLACGHQIHGICEYNVFVCRICKIQYRVKPEPIPLHRYLEQ